MAPGPKSRRLYPQYNSRLVVGLWRYIWSRRSYARLRRFRSTEKSNYKPWMMNQFLEILPSDGRYMEIGLRKGRTFERVRARKKLGIDPNPEFNLDWLPKGTRVYRGTSDDFFSGHFADPSFDLIFIDGLHTFAQVARDVLNSLGWVSRKGVIVIDDCWPRSAVGADPRGKSADTDNVEPGWWGDVWKVMPLLVSELPNNAFYLVGERGRAFCVLWGNTDSGTKERLSARISEFESIDSSVFFQGDFEKCQLPAAELDYVLAEYRQFVANQ